jgi:hypothetical protein
MATTDHQNVESIVQTNKFHTRKRKRETQPSHHDDGGCAFFTSNWNERKNTKALLIFFYSMSFSAKKELPSEVSVIVFSVDCCNFATEIKP